MANSYRALIRALLGFASVALCVELSAAATFVEIPGLIEATAISDDGSTVVGTQWTASAVNAVRWRRGGSLDILGDFPGGHVYSSASDVSADGSVVVGVGEFDRYEETTSPFREVEKRAAFRWTAATGLQNLMPLTRDTPNTAANSVSADGLEVFGAGDVGFRWTESAGVQPTPIVPADASADGALLVGIEPSFARNPQRWSADDGVMTLPKNGAIFPSGYGEPLVAVSDDGTMIYGNHKIDFGGSWHTYPFRWSKAQGLQNVIPDRIFGHSVSAYDASADGQLLVGQYHRFDNYPPHDFRAFMWSEAGGVLFVDNYLSSLGIDLTGWKLQKATGVSADGTVIVGTGINPQGFESSWLVALVPEPSSGTIAVTWCGAAAAFRRFRSAKA